MQDLNFKVQKSDGSFEQFTQNKINLAIDWAGDGLGLDLGVLKKNITAFFVDGISTSIIREQLVTLALSLTSPEEPQWRFVAARLLLLNTYKKAKKTQGHTSFGYSDYASFVYDAVSKGVYDSTITDNYNESELREFAKEINPEYDLGFDYAGVEMLVSRYIFKYKGDIYELPQHRYATIALLAASKERKYNRLNIAKKFYHAIASRKLSPATPIMLNLGKPNGNLASCFILAADDSLNSIYYALNQAAQISKNAGGVGVNLSRIRGHGSSIRGVKNASGGVNPWVKLFNDTSISVNQLGSRKGAITVALDVWHYDIETFLELQTENGDQRVKAFDVFPQIVLNDVFKEAWRNKSDWYLFCPYEIKNKYGYDLAELWGYGFSNAYKHLIEEAKESKIDLFKVVKANELVREALMVAVETGLPYWMNKDTANRSNPNKHAGMIGSANLCVESFSNFAPSQINDQYITVDENGEVVLKQTVKPGYVHTCNLVSPNASLIEEEEIPEFAELSVRFLDNLIDIAVPPIAESQLHNDDYRILGIGSLGLADMFVKNGCRYGTQDSIEVASRFFETFAYYAINASSDLAVDRGQYKYFKGSDWEKGVFFGRHVHSNDWYTNTDLDWKGLAVKVNKQGMRNGGLFAIAPNTSTSLLVGASASILPIYGKYYTETNGVLTTPFVAQFLNDETFWLYTENKNTNQRQVIDVVSAIQDWTDQGISFEPLINLEHGNLGQETEQIRGKDIADMYMYAMDKNLKTVYYLRSKIKNSDGECTSCAN